MTRVTPMDFPPQSKITLPNVKHDYCDAFKVRVSKHALNAPYVYHSIFGFLPKPVQWAMRLRNLIMQCFGFAASESRMSLPLDAIKTGQQAGFLTIELACDNEVICTASEKNMDMWLSVIKLSEQEFAVATRVHLHTLSGRIYMALIKPFHRLVARYSINQALKAGRL